jgi:hypothetical protein
MQLLLAHLNDIICDIKINAFVWIENRRDVILARLLYSRLSFSRYGVRQFWVGRPVSFQRSGVCNAVQPLKDAVTVLRSSSLCHLAEQKGGSKTNNVQDKVVMAGSKEP